MPSYNPWKCAQSLFLSSHASSYCDLQRCCLNGKELCPYLSNKYGAFFLPLHPKKSWWLSTPSVCFIGALALLASVNSWSVHSETLICLLYGTHTGLRDTCKMHVVLARGKDHMFFKHSLWQLWNTSLQGRWMCVLLRPSLRGLPARGPFLAIYVDEGLRLLPAHSLWHLQWGCLWLAPVDTEPGDTSQPLLEHARARMCLSPELFGVRMTEVQNPGCVFWGLPAGREWYSVFPHPFLLPAQGAPAVGSFFLFLPWRNQGFTWSVLHQFHKWPLGFFVQRGICCLFLDSWLPLMWISSPNSCTAAATLRFVQLCGCRMLSQFGLVGTLPLRGQEMG